MKISFIFVVAQYCLVSVFKKLRDIEPYCKRKKRYMIKNWETYKSNEAVVRERRNRKVIEEKYKLKINKNNIK